MKHHPTPKKKKQGCAALCGVGMFGILLLAAGSLYTPYPIELARLLLGKEEPKSPVVKPEPKP